MTSSSSSFLRGLSACYTLTANFPATKHGSVLKQTVLNPITFSWIANNKSFFSTQTIQQSSGRTRGSAAPRDAVNSIFYEDIWLDSATNLKMKLCAANAITIIVPLQMCCPFLFRIVTTVDMGFRKYPHALPCLGMGTCAACSNVLHARRRIPSAH